MRFGDKLMMRAANAVNIAKRIAGNGVKQFVEIVSSQPFFLPPSADARKLLDLYNKSPWVRSIVGKIAHGVAKQPWYLERPNGERVDEHPALAWLRAGNAKMRGRQSIAMTQKYIDLVGEAFWILGRTGLVGGQLTDYAVIPPHWVIDIPHDGQPNYTIVPRTGQQFDIPPEQVLWFRDPDPTDPYGRGRSLTGAASVEIKTDEAAADFLYSHFMNHCRPAVIVSGTETAPLQDVDRRRAEIAWGEKFRGVEKAGRTFFSSRPLNVAEFGFGLRDNAVPQMRTQIAQTLSEIWNMPPELLGRLESSNRATIESADYLFALHLLDPRLAFILDVLEPFLIVEFGITGLRLCYETPVKDDRTQVLAVMSAFRTNFTGNEVRQLAGLRAKDGLDDLMEQTSLLGSFGGGPTANDPAANDNAGNDPAAGPKALPAPATKALTADDIMRVSSAHEDPQVRAQAELLMDQVFTDLLVKYGAELLEQLESTFDFTVNTQVAAWLADKQSGLMPGIDETTRRDLQATLVEGVAASEDVEQLAARVEELYAAAADTRASQIGITEATELTGFGTQAASTQAGFQEKMWLSTQDQAVRDTHRDLDGQVVHMTDKFTSSSGAQADYPGGFGVAAEDINCRCAIRPVLPGEGKMTKPQFRTWHAYAHAHVSDGIRKKAALVFSAQAEVTKAMLRRIFV